MKKQKNHLQHILQTPVPFIVVSDKVKEVRNGALCDIAPTLLTLAGLEVPAEMTGKSLID